MGIKIFKKISKTLFPSIMEDIFIKNAVSVIW